MVLAFHCCFFLPILHTFAGRSPSDVFSLQSFFSRLLFILVLLTVCSSVCECIHESIYACVRIASSVGKKGLLNPANLVQFQSGYHTTPSKAAANVYLIESRVFERNCAEAIGYLSARPGNDCQIGGNENKNRLIRLEFNVDFFSN